MNTLILILIPAGVGVLAGFAGRASATLARLLTFAGLLAAAILAIVTAIGPAKALFGSGNGHWFAAVQAGWVPRLGIHLQLGLDGLSLTLILLTLFLGMVATVMAGREIRSRWGLFYANMNWTLAGMIGVFLALDLFEFFLFWELMLIPMFLLIAVWGREGRKKAALRFFIFTQAGSMVLIISIIALAMGYFHKTGTLSFSLFDLKAAGLPPTVAFWAMLAMLVGLAVKMPVVPLHNWQPAAYAQAPAVVALLLGGAMAKTGAYALIRFLHPLFPHATDAFAPVGMAFAVATILYGGFLTYAQSDFRRIIAYSSISHMGYILLGLFAWTQLALQGAVMQMVAHGLTVGGLFVLAAALHARMGTSDIYRMKGLWYSVPRLGGMGLVFALASMGLPGLANFIGEFLVLLGTFPVSYPAVAFGVLGVVVSVIYALMWMHRIYQGPQRSDLNLLDGSGREMAVMGAIVLLILWLGLYPQPLFHAVGPALDTLRHLAGALPAQA
jgi:NADH-quinone oxidoreductase subunit M